MKVEIAFLVAGIGLVACGESFEDVERRLCLKPSPPPMAAPAAEVELTDSDGRLGPAACRDISLDGTWRMRADGEREEIDANVPGSVHSALLAAGRLDDPYFSTNDFAAAKASFRKWVLRRTFDLSAADLQGSLRLCFDGVCDVCAVLLNGKPLGTHTGMFGGPEFDVDGKLVAGRNELEVRLDPAPYWKPAPNSLSGPYDNQGWRSAVVFNCCYGWHYALVPARGIWRSVRIRRLPAVSVDEPFVATKATDGTMDFHVVLSGTGTFSGRLRGEIRPANFTGRAQAFVHEVSGKGRETVRLRFRIADPHLWWPAGYGEPNLYTMTLRFEDAHGVGVSGARFDFGIRTIETRPAGRNGVSSPDCYDWLTVINGTPVFLKGTGWCTMDALMRFTPERYARFLDVARRQNVNFIRAWGCGLVELDAFYDLCDRYGICVMQEWPTAWDSYTRQPRAALAETVERGVRRLRNRASLVFWCGGNEGQAPLDGNVENLNLIGRRTLELDGTRPWHRQETANRGSRHVYSASWGWKNPAVMMTKESVFFGEFGVDAFPCMESVRKYTPAAELTELERTKGTPAWHIVPDGAIAHHTPKFNSTNDVERLSQHVAMFLSPDSLENVILGSQIAQAIGVRYTLERARTRFPDCAGASMYKLNDVYPAASWATVDWYGTEKYASFVIADALAPLTAIARLDKLRNEGVPLAVPLFVVDDGDELKAAGVWTVSLRAYDAALSVVRRLDVSGAGSVDRLRRLGELKLTAEEASSVPLWLVADVTVDGVLRGRNFYYVNFEARQGCLFGGPKATLDVAVADGTYVIRNTGTVPAVNVHFVCPRVSDRLVADDNFFWLDPGEVKRVKVNLVEGIDRVACWNACVGR